jgi:2-polyprenyl-3-methyl-5-hydroxy-6-metoxy-1,4-benzoquinol methylase
VPKRVKSGSHFSLNVFVDELEDSKPRNDIALARLSYSWLESGPGLLETNSEPLRTPLLNPPLAGQHGLHNMQVRAPSEPGTYGFLPRIVLEGVRWIENTRDPYIIEVTDFADSPDNDLERYEDRLYSQNGEDGILRELLLRIGLNTRFVVEIGAGDGTENNSRQLIEEYNFGALLVEGDAAQAARLKERHATRSDVTTIAAFVDADSLFETVSGYNGPREPDILSIDVDGNDFYLWRASANLWNPRIVVIEYNASRGPEEDWVMPYDAAHRWIGNNHFGASLTALSRLGTELGYALIGTNSSGVNAFFIRCDLLPQVRFPQKAPADAYHALHFSGIAPVTKSSDIRDKYTRTYYVNNCGGYADFDYDDPLSIADPRLRVTASFADVRGGKRALDIGCGRGEIAAYLGAIGWLVDAVDYSPDAISLATHHLERTRVSAERVRFHTTDFASFHLESDAYDLVIAADVIEHLAEDELTRLYARVSGALKKGGLFVVHTYPNAWYYKYEWPRLRRLASLRGEALPENPRSEFERVMHINEQSPRTLSRQLRSSFSHVALWVGNPLDPFHSDLANASRAALRQSPDIFAVAGHDPVHDVATSDVFLRQPLSPAERAAILVEPADRLRRRSDGGWDVALTICNNSMRTLSSAGNAPVMLSYHWLGDAGETILRDGRRTPLGHPLRPGETVTRHIRVECAPAGGSALRATLVQEGVAWFDEDGVYVDLFPTE